MTEVAPPSSPSPCFLLVTGSAEAVRYYYLFKNSVLAGIRADHRTLPVRDVQAWLGQAREGEPGMLTRLGRVGADGALLRRTRLSGACAPPVPFDKADYRSE